MGVERVGISFLFGHGSASPLLSSSGSDPRTHKVAGLPDRGEVVAEFRTSG